MKTIAIIAALGMAVEVYGQSTVAFANISDGTLNVPFFDSNGVLLSGSNYVAQLYAGNAADSLFGIGQRVGFATGSHAGYFAGGTGHVPYSITGGACGPAWVQVRAWDVAGGDTFEQAALSGYWSGISSILYLSSTGGCGEPPFVAAPLYGLEYPGLPLILQQPLDRRLHTNDFTKLWVVASGGAKLSYQWYQGTSGDTNAPIPGATEDNYYGPATDTTYWVRVSTSAGSTDSRTATVLIIPYTLGSLSVRMVAGLPILTIDGSAGTTVQVQYNPDLNPAQWNLLTNVFREQNPFSFIDSTASGVSTRYYRLALP